jgi:NAD(P)-dependent dehydrogenase (short-subunit alcohol dehydrogenase family)
MTPALAGRKSDFLSGKHAVVTGGARGIGAAITRALLDHGARVTVLGRSVEPQSQGTLDFKKSGRWLYVKADVGDPVAVAHAFESARARSGPIDILVNNAGQAASAPFLKTDSNLWRRMMTVNLDGTVHCIQSALPGMLSAGWGRIINMASTAGLTGYAYVTAYCASKHAIVGLTRALALEVATKSVTVNAVCPGFTDTELLKESVANIVAKTGRTPEEARAELASRNPQKRLVEPEEVANAVAWLCLPGSEAVTGQTIAVAGGEVM